MKLELTTEVFCFTTEAQNQIFVLQKRNSWTKLLKEEQKHAQD